MLLNSLHRHMTDVPLKQLVLALIVQSLSLFPLLVDTETIHELIHGDWDAALNIIGAHLVSLIHKFFQDDYNNNSQTKVELTYT